MNSSESTVLHLQGEQPPAPLPSRLVAILHHSFAVAPLLTVAWLYLFSFRVATVIGYWPRPSIDDPKFVAPNDIIADLMYLAVVPLLMWSVAGLLLFPVLSYLQRRAYPRAWAWFLVALFVISFAVLRADPGARMAWYAD